MTFTVVSLELVRDHPRNTIYWWHVIIERHRSLTYTGIYWTAIIAAAIAVVVVVVVIVRVTVGAVESYSWL
jgi:uncharacterized membrane protein